MPKCYGNNVVVGGKALGEQELYNPANRKKKLYNKKLSKDDEERIAEQILRWGVPSICACCKYCNPYDQWCRNKMERIFGAVFHCTTFKVSKERLADIEAKKLVR